MGGAHPVPELAEPARASGRGAAAARGVGAPRPARRRPGRDLGDRRLGDRLDRALAGLPPGQREAVWLVDGLGLKFSEAAEVLDLQPGTVASRVARGRAALRVELAELARERGVIS
ncbi:MAG: hypothetical protein H6741_35195 [Alphaproteobacteria bacterium]|nr:hypothetical protein [Alphaproteobacteria bacterium]